MSSPVQQRSPMVRILDAFLHEENIKWVLGLGVCILLGSSLRLVTLHWVEYTPVWKYLILLTYTAAVFGLGELCYHRLGLRKTGTVLMSLTVLLIPLGFLALHWIQPRDDVPWLDGLRNAGLMGLLGINLAWSAFVSRRIFNHFLRRPQPTFLVCHLILCLAGAIVPGLPHAWSPVVALFLWAVFAVGTVKVNRHVFWLTEEHRLPRIFGFFPIALLGAQFAAVFALGLAGQLTPAWFGLLCTLISLPILLTADTVARVFEQRTGGLVRPIPWSISGPLALGTLLSVSGVILALSYFPGNSVIVPTAIIATIAMAVVAHRTRNTAFVWGMVICTMIAYQTCPVFFKELVMQIRDQAAAAVRESRLPYAFYGLTYAPLITVFSIVGSILLRRGNSMFGTPLQQTATGLSLVLMAASFTHPSAILPVSLVLCPMFLVQMLLFRQRHYLIPAAAACLAGAYGAPGFAVRVWEWNVSPEMRLLVWTVASGLLFVPGVFVDRRARSLQHRDEDFFVTPILENVCQLFSLGGTIAAMGLWSAQTNLGSIALDFGPSSMTVVLIGLLLVAHALRWLMIGLGEMTLAFLTYAVHLHVMHGEPLAEGCINSICLLLLGQWVLSYLLERIPASRIATAFGPASYRVSTIGLGTMFGVFVIGWVKLHTEVAVGNGTLSLLMMAWGLDASRRIGNSRVAEFVWCSLFVFVSAAFTSCIGLPNAAPWWMTVWAATGVVLQGIRRLLPTAVAATEIASDDNPASATAAMRQQIINWLAPLDTTVPVLFLAIATISVPFLSWQQRFAAVVALCGLAASNEGPMRKTAIAILGPLFNWHLLVAMIALLTGRTGLASMLTTEDMRVCGMPLAALAGISLWAFEFRVMRRRVTHGELLVAHQFTLAMTVMGLLFGALQWNLGHGWSPVNVLACVTAFVTLAGAAFTNSVRVQDRDWASAGQWVLAGGVIYSTFTGFLVWTNLEVMYAVLLVGVLQWMAAQWMARSTSLAILVEPLQTVGFWLPLGVVPLALNRQFHALHLAWTGANSLPLLGAAAFYFWRGIERRHVATTVLSAVILNVACALLWNDVGWTDPQLFLMPIGVSFLVLTELLRQEIPSQYHNRIRLSGSLVILVSPVFHIVTGSWMHILTLMLASAALALVGIGLRVRTLLYTSTAFLLADLVALVARSSVDEPNVLWIAGIALGTAIIALGAICENHRETVLARLRGLAAELEQWA